MRIKIVGKWELEPLLQEIGIFLQNFIKQHDHLIKAVKLNNIYLNVVTHEGRVGDLAGPDGESLILELKKPPEPKKKKPKLKVLKGGKT